MRRIIYLCILFWGGMSINAFSQTIMGAREIGLGGAVTALPNNGWAVFENPAMLSDSAKSVDFYTMRYYGMTDLTDYAAAITYPASIGTFAVGAHTYGGKLFRKSRIRAGFMHNVHHVRLGVVINYTDVVFPSPYGSAGALGIDVGLAAKVMKGTWIAARSVNINGPNLGSKEEPLPRILAIGFSYQWRNRFMITSEVYKDTEFPISIRAGLEAQIVSILKLRAGITTEPLTYALGLGITKNKWQVNLAAQKHYVLGWSPGVDFEWKIDGDQ